MIYIYGKHAVLSAVANKRRKISKIIISKNNKEFFDKFLSEKQIKIDKNLIKIADNNYISSLLPENSSHQGFALYASNLPTISDSEFLLNLNQDKLPKLLILDQLTDPHNIGAIIRSSVAFGVKNIVITKHNFAKDSAIICKSSTGAIELVNIIIAGNVNNLLANLKKVGYWCIGLDGAARSNINKIKDYENIALIIGSEGSGIRPLVKKNCDLLVKIPIAAEVESLNASNAAAIALYNLYPMFKL